MKNEFTLSEKLTEILKKQITLSFNKLKRINLNKEVSSVLEAIKILLNIALSAVKSFIFALSQIVWVFAGVLIIGAVIVFLIKSGDIKTMTELPKGLGYVIDIFNNYWQWFFGGIWIFDFIINFKDINKK